MKKSLENHPIGDELEDALEQIDMENLAMQHLESCHYIFLSVSFDTTP